MLSQNIVKLKESRIVDYQVGPLTTVLLHQNPSDKRSQLLRDSSLPMEGNIDRNGVLDFGLNCVVLDPMPKRDSSFSMSFEQVCYEVARGIIDETRPFAVYMSGGLDSTTMLSAFFQAGATPEQMTIVWNSSTIAEYPLYFERYIKPWPNLREISPSVWPEVRYDELFATGELGDQLAGSVWATLYDESFPNRNDRWHSLGPYSDCLTKHWHHHIKLKYPKEIQNDLIEMYEPLMAVAPFKIYSVFDFLWWANFSCKWQHVTMRMGARMRDIDQYHANNRAFYRDERFQQWAMNEVNHRERKTGDHVDSYKLMMRDYIEAFTGDAIYARYKKKVGSLPMKIARRYMMLLESGERVRFGGQECNDVAAYVVKYGNRFDSLFS